LREQMQIAEDLTINNDRLILNVVINYGGKWDIVQAVKTLAQQVADGKILLEAIDEAAFAAQLSMHDLPAPDLFIRTSGEQRISNFFLWQLAYTELYFTDVFWPDFTSEEFEKALACFGSRERRYGKTSRQVLENGHV
jgi:undecaprenyl diphosphate synthase